MSWQAYVDTSLVGSGHLDKAAIISIAGDSVWAASPDFTIAPEEMKNIVALVNNEDAAVAKAQAEGIHIGGSRYVFTRIEDGNIYVRQGRDGIAISPAKQLILVGHHNETQQAGNATQTVQGLKDHFVGQGY